METGEDGEHGDTEEPKAHGPQEDGNENGNDTEDLGCRDVAGPRHVVHWELRYRDFCHARQGETSKSWRSNGDEHPRTSIRVRKASCHQATDVVCVHEQGDDEAEALECGACNNDGNGLRWRLVLCNERGNCSR